MKHVSVMLLALILFVPVPGLAEITSIDVYPTYESAGITATYSGNNLVTYSVDIQ